MVDSGTIRCRWLEGNGPDEAEGAEREWAALRAEAASREAYLGRVAEGGEKEEVAVAEFLGGPGTEGVIAELFVDVAIALGQLKKMGLGVVHESPLVLFLAGVQQNQCEKGAPYEGICQGVTHVRDCGLEGRRRESET